MFNITCCAQCNCSKVQSWCSDQHRCTIGSVCRCSFLVFSINAQDGWIQILGQAFLWSSLSAEIKRNIYMLRQCVKKDLWPGLNLCRNKPDPDPAPHFVESPSSRANERRLYWPIMCIYEKSSLMTTLAAHPHLKKFLNTQKTRHVNSSALTRHNARINSLNRAGA